jgi:diketogulonate reductase-like aldo/keto reductase
VFRFALDAGMLPLTGTSDPGHMREALAAADLALTRAESTAIERSAGAPGRLLD